MNTASTIRSAIRATIDLVETLIMTACLLLLVCALSAPVFAKAPIAKNARLGGDDKKVKFVAELSKKVPIKIFTLDNPYRVIIDLPEVKFQFPPRKGRKGKGLVSAYRYGLFAPGKSRIVIDVKGPVAVKNAQVLPIKGKKSAKMVIELAKTDAAKFSLNLSKRYLMEDFDKKPQKKAKANPAQPAVKRRSNDRRPMIIIDPGHGGVDPGAIGAKGTLEKNVVLTFSKLLLEKLKKTGQFQVAMTRDKDIYVPLHDRVKFGRKKQADLFISIHADSVAKRKRRRHLVRGASIYILSESASDEEAQALAAMENRADIIAGVELPESENPVTNILIDLAQRETNTLSAFFADLHIKSMQGVVRLHGRETRSAGFRVLKAPDTPSVLLELGYLSSVRDEKNLKSRKWQNKMANVIVKSVKSYFSQKVAKSPF